MNKNMILSSVFLCFFFFTVVVSASPNFWEEGNDGKPAKAHNIAVLPSSKQCFSPAGVAVGPAGLQDIKPPNSFVGIVFERKGFNCECSFVSFLFKLLIISYCINFVFLSQRFEPMKLILVLNRPLAKG